MFTGIFSLQFSTYKVKFRTCVRFDWYWWYNSKLWSANWDRSYEIYMANYEVINFSLIYSIWTENVLLHHGSAWGSLNHKIWGTLSRGSAMSHHDDMEKTIHPNPKLDIVMVFPRVHFRQHMIKKVHAETLGLTIHAEWKNKFCGILSNTSVYQ